MAQGNLKKPVVGTSDDDTITVSDVGSFKINGGSGNDIIEGSNGFDWINAGDGDDTIFAKAGDDYINGGSGYDLAVYSGSVLSYTLTDGTGNTINFEGPDGRDELRNVEALQFDDYTLYIDGRNNNAYTVDDFAQSNEDQTILIDVLSNDVDFDGDTLQITSVGSASHGTVSLTPEGLVEFVPEANFSGTATFEYTVDDGSGGVSIGIATVEIAAVADTPTLTVSNASGDEDNAIALNVSAALADLDGSETLSIVIANVPDGASLSAGTNNADGTWTLTADQLAGLTVTPAADSSDDFTLIVTATATESSNGDASTSTANILVQVNAVADAPVLTVSDASGDEDTAIALDVSAVLADLDGSETLSIVISGVPDGATLSAGTNNSDGTWTLTADQLVGLAVTPAADSSNDFTITVTATATETSNGDALTSTANILVAVNAVADAPVLTVSDASGDEDTAIALDVSAALVDLDGSETLSIVIANVPDGATLSAGTNNADGTWTLTANQLAGLTVTPAADSSEDFTLSVSAVATESSNGNTSVVTEDIQVAVTEVPDGNTPSPFTDGADTLDFNHLITPTSPFILVNQYTDGAQRDAQIGVDSDGNIKVVWDSLGQFGSPTKYPFEMLIRNFDASGTPVSNEAYVNDTHVGAQQRGDIATAADGRTIVVWNDRNHLNGEIAVKAKIYNSDGSEASPELTIDDFSSQSGSPFKDPEVIVEDSGDFAVFWNKADADGDSLGIVGQWFNSNGVALTDQITINSTIAHNQLGVSAASNGKGEIIVAWQSNAADGLSQSVYAQKMDSSGNFIGEEVLVGTTNDSGTVPMSVRTDIAHDGRFVVSWSDYSADDSGIGIWSRQFASDGSALTDAFVVNNETQGNQAVRGVAFDDHGNHIISWGTHMQVFDENGDRQGGQDYSDYGGWVTFGNDGELYGVYTSLDNGRDLGQFIRTYDYTVLPTNDGLFSDAASGNDYVVLPETDSYAESIGFSDGLIFNGGAGNDTIVGLDRADHIEGGENDDLLTGGSNSDTFYFSTNSGNDIITDFEIGTDHLTLLGLQTIQSIEATADTNGDGQVDTIVTFDTGTVTLLGVQETDVSTLFIG